MALKINSTIPAGNAGDVAVQAERGRTVVSFAADPHGGPETLWFCFRITGRRAPGSLRLVLKHVTNLLGVGGEHLAGLRPVVREAGGDWRRLPAPRRVEFPDGRLAAAWELAMPRLPADVALCYPYGEAEVRALLRATGGCYRADTLGLSQGGRPLVRLSNAPGEAGSRRPGLYLVARQHAGETPGSWVLDGFLRRMATQGARAPLIWAVPLANIDGVVQGDYGKDNFPHDLNRAWGRPPMRHETLVVGADVWRFKARCRPLLAIDFHAPGACESDGMYLFLPKPEAAAAHHRAAVRWARRLQRALAPAYAAADFGRVARYPSRWELPTFSQFAFEHLGVPGLSLETPYGCIGELALTRKHYGEAGARMADAIVAALRR